MDFRIYHAVNTWSAAHAGFVHALSLVENALVVLITAAAVLLWLAARPGGSRKWKLASASALATGALAFVANQVIHALWDRPRPYESHPGVWHPYASSTDASFPSDHTSAAFGLAFGVFLYDRLVGSIFLVVAAVLAWLRVVIGFHYPADIGAGVLVALVAAVAVKAARPLIARLAELVEKLTDPVLRPLWRRAV